MAGVEKTISDDVADAAIDEILIRAGHRKPHGPDGYRWAAEGKRRIRDLDTTKAWLAGK